MLDGAREIAAAGLNESRFASHALYSSHLSPEVALAVVAVARPAAEQVERASPSRTVSRRSKPPAFAKISRQTAIQKRESTTIRNLIKSRGAIL